MAGFYYRRLPHPTSDDRLYPLIRYPFNLIPHIKLQSRVKGIDYDGPSSDTWSLWNGTGEAFPPEDKWHVTVENAQTATTQVYTVDFVLLCVGRFKDVPSMPQFPARKGPEVVRGRAMHSLEYVAMDHDEAEEFVKGKKVVVVGFGKSGLDIARECSSINGPENPCSIVYRRDHWKLSRWFIWGIPLVDIMFSRSTMLSVHKPGEGFLLSLLATLLSPVGSIKLKKSPSFEFYEKGIFISDDNTHIEADIVNFATGFNGVDKLAHMFGSKTFRHYIADSPRVPLYR
ncbi:putative flavin-containing monooxygenase [Helianthus anomalus]